MGDPHSSNIIFRLAEKLKKLTSNVPTPEHPETIKDSGILVSQNRKKF